MSIDCKTKEDYAWPTTKWNEINQSKSSFSNSNLYRPEIQLEIKFSPRFLSHTYRSRGTDVRIKHSERIWGHLTSVSQIAENSFCTKSPECLFRHLRYSFMRKFTHHMQESESITYFMLKTPFKEKRTQIRLFEKNPHKKQTTLLY